jgi:hypothetical protein
MRPTLTQRLTFLKEKMAQDQFVIQPHSQSSQKLDLTWLFSSETNQAAEKLPNNSSIPTQLAFPQVGPILQGAPENILLCSGPGYHVVSA